MKNEINSSIIIGKNTVLEALRSGRDMDAVYLLRGREDARLLAEAKKRGIVVKSVPKDKLDELAAPFGHDGAPGNHQGAAASVAQVAYADMEDIFKKAEEAGKAPFIVALDGITDPHNLGAIIRSAEALGAHGVVLPKRRSAPMSAAVAKAASGAEEHIPIVRVTNLPSTIDELKKRGIFAACADMKGEDARRTNLTGAILLVIGSEGEGVSRLVKDKCDFTIKIDMPGKIDSLNASVAAGILMYEKQRQEITNGR